ncbi:MAG: glycosyltransferase [Armatimonadetes bacterium]|nr:glycosyltransferase [Armatimonadota bacterium]
MKIVHLCAAHQALDNRIFYRECRTLAQAGHEVVLVAPCLRDERVDDVQIRAVRPGNRWSRWTRTTAQILVRALAERGDVYHLHEPGLIPVGLLLAGRGREVVYDIHDDLPASLSSRCHTPWLAALCGWLEARLANRFHQILAEACYQKRMPQGLIIQNYPLLSLFRVQQPPERGACKLIYTGVNSVLRGLDRHAGLVSLVPGAELHLVGRFPPHLAQRARAAAGAHADRLHLLGVSDWVPYERVLTYYRETSWTAGLALFPPGGYYQERMLTKFFEYMACGIPILCSDFPLWKNRIEGAGAGLCVDPENDGQIESALEFLSQNPEEAAEMGRRGRELVETRYHWDGEAGKLLDLYRRLKPSEARGASPAALRNGGPVKLAPRPPTNPVD